MINIAIVITLAVICYVLLMGLYRLTLLCDALAHSPSAIEPVTAPKPITECGVPVTDNGTIVREIEHELLLEQARLEFPEQFNVPDIEKQTMFYE